MLAENTSIVDFELVTKPQKMRIEGCPGSLDAVDAAGRVNRAKRMSIVGSKVEPTELVDCRRRRANPMQKDGARGEMIAVRVQRRQPSESARCALGKALQYCKDRHCKGWHCKG